MVAAATTTVLAEAAACRWWRSGSVSSRSHFSPTVLEYVGPLRRTLVANLAIALFYMGGTVMLPWLALWVANWRLLTALAAIPMILACLAHWLLPESARWLLSQGTELTTFVMQSLLQEQHPA